MRTASYVVSTALSPFMAHWCVAVLSPHWIHDSLPEPVLPRKSLKEPLLPEKLLSPWPAPWVEQRARAVRIMQGGAGADPEANTVSAGRAIDYRVLSSSLHCWLPSTPLSHLEVRSSSTQKQLQAQTLLYSSDLLWCAISPYHVTMQWSGQHSALCSPLLFLKSLVESTTGHPQGLHSDPILRN